MADLLSPGEWQEFRDAIKDVFDTFADTPVTIRRRTTTLSAVNQNRKNDNVNTDTIINAVFIQIGSDTDAQYKLNEKGTINCTCFISIWINIRWRLRRRRTSPGTSPSTSPCHGRTAKDHA